MLTLLGGGQPQNFVTQTINLIQTIVDDFKTRVTNDSAIFEAENCLKDTLTTLNEIE